MRVAVIILNYNSSADCRKCIGFLKLQGNVDQEIVVVDNCSRYDDRIAVENLCKEQECTFIANHENKGYSAGNNIGLRYAAEKGYEYALVANPDMEFPQTDYLSKVLQKMAEDGTIAVCASDIITPAGEHQNPMRESSYYEELLWPITAFKNRKNNQWFVGDYQKSDYCEKVSGCCFAIRISFLQEIGFLDEAVFLYSEEPILAKQIKQYKYKLFFLSEAKAIHRHIESKKGNKMERLKLFYSSRIYYLDHYSGYTTLQLKILKFSKSIQLAISNIVIK